MTWFMRQRQDFIRCQLQTFGMIRRNDIAEKYGVTMQVASADIAAFVAEHPDTIDYDRSAKCYTFDGATLIAPAVDAKARADMAAALRNTPAEALREAGYLERAAQMIEAPAVDAVPAGEVGEGIKLASDWLRANINNPMIPHWCDAMLDSLGVTNGVADLLAALSHGEGRK